MERLIAVLIFVLAAMLLASGYLSDHEALEERKALQGQISQKNMDLENCQLYTQWLISINGNKGTKDNPLEVKQGDIIPHIGALVGDMTAGENARVWFDPLSGTIEGSSLLIILPPWDGAD